MSGSGRGAEVAGSTVVAERLADAPRSPVAVTSTHHRRRPRQRSRFRVQVHGPGGAWLLERVVGLLGSPAPGPLPLLLPPHPRTLTRTPAATFHQLGIERARAHRIVRACAALDRLDAALTGARGADRLAAMTAVEGVGPWTAAHLIRVGTGDADAVEVGDHNVKHLVAWNLAGEARATDERMLTLLAPFAGHRGRVVRLLASAGQWPPRFAHRHPLLPVERL